MPFGHDMTGVKEGGGSRHAPGGVYVLRVTEPKEGQTRNDDPKVDCKIVIDSGPFKGVWCYHTVAFLGRDENGNPMPGAGIAKHFLKIIGEPFEGNINVSGARWEGKRFKGRLEVVKSQCGKYDNNKLTLETWALDDPESPDVGVDVAPPKGHPGVGAQAAAKKDETDLEEVPF